MSTIIGEAVIVVGADGQLFVKELEQKTKPAAQKSGLNIAGAVGKGMATGAKIAGGLVAGVIGTALVKGFSRLTAIDDAKGKLVGLGYSAQQVTSIMNNALTSVKGTAFGLGDAASQAAILVGAGIKPGQELTRTLKLLADTTTIAGTSLSDVGGIFSSMAAGGKATNGALQQLQDRGVPALQLLAKSLGLSNDETFKLVSQGKVSFAQFQTAMEKGLGGAALASGKTFTGALKNVGAALGRLGAKLLGGVFSQLPALFGDAIGALDGLEPVATKVGEVLGEKLGQAVGVVRELADQFSKGEGAGGALRSVLELLGKALLALWDAGVKTLDYLRQHQALAEALAVSMGTLLAITQAHASYLAVQAAGGLIKYLTQMNLVTTATKVWAAIQWVLNSALLAWPGTWIIAGIVALVAGIVLLWKHNETFRNIVLAVWGAIQTAIGAVVDWITGTMVPAIVGAWDAVVGAAQTVWAGIVAAWDGVMGAAQVLWDTITAVWDGISSGAQAVWEVITTVWDGIIGTLTAVGSWINDTFGPWFQTLEKIVEFVFKAIEILILAWWKLVVMPTFEAAKLALGKLGDAFTWLYNNAVKPAWDLIVSAIKIAWGLIKAVWDLIVSGLSWLGDKFTALYNSYIKPVWDKAVAIVKADWALIKVIWDAIVKALGVLGDWFNDLYQKYVKPAWDFISDAIKVGWNTVISPAFDALKKGVDLIAQAFDKAKDGIKVAWDKLKAIAQAPIKFVIETVLNNGLIKAFNWLGSKVGGPHIDNIPLPFAQGGVTPGYTPGRDVHLFYSPTGGALALSGGEAIMRPEFTRAMGGKAGIERLNKLAKAGLLQGPGNFSEGGVHHYDLGGVVDWIKGQSSAALSWVGDTSSAIWKALSNPLDYIKSKLPSIPAVGVLSDFTGAAVSKLVTLAVDKVKSLFSDFNEAYDSIGGPIFAKMKAWVMAHLGIPYVWGGTGPAGYDCIAEGTPVTTLRGDVPIEQVVVGDLVLTRRGYRAVTRAWLVRRAAPTVEIQVSGQMLRGTADHRVWTDNRGWVGLGDVTRYDTLVSCPAVSESSSTDTHTSVTRTLHGQRIVRTFCDPTTAFTVPSGATTTDQSPLGTRSTTSTMTRTITTSPTLRWSRSASIGGRVKPPVGYVTTSAPNVVPSSSPSGQTATPLQARGDSAATSTRTISTIGVAKPSGTSDVYDLTVEGEHEFFAAGVLVHNCSGFTQAANAAAGISIPRTSQQQQAFARAVAASAIKPGDLGFVGRPAEHVELYMGSGQWAEAPHTGDVTKIIGQSVSGFTSLGATFAQGGVLRRALLMDNGGVLPKGPSLVQNNTGAPEALVRAGMGDQYDVSIKLSIDDLSKLRTLDDFLKMLEEARSTTRKTQRSGKVSV